MANSKISALTSATTPLAGTETLPIVQSGVTKQVSVANLTAGRAVSASDLTAGVGGTGNTTAYLRLQGSSAANYGPAIYAYRNGVNKWFIASESDYLGGSGDNPWIVSNGTTLNLSVASTGATAGFKLTSTDGTFTGINLTQGTAAKGINFTANTPQAGMTSQLLNWYEEGTFTPTVSGSTGGSATYYTNSGTYTRTGNLVYFRLRIACASVTGMTGSAQINGLPFTVKAGGGRNVVNCDAPAGLTLYPTISSISGTFASGNVIFLSDNSGNIISAAAYTNTFGIDITGVYNV